VLLSRTPNVLDAVFQAMKKGFAFFNFALESRCKIAYNILDKHRPAGEAGYPHLT